MRIRVILAKPEDFRNVGAVVRVAAFFGAAEVVIVRAEDLTGEETALVRVASAGMVDDVKVRRVETIAEAAEGCDVLLGATARARRDFHVGAPDVVLDQVCREGAREVGLLFGRESTGLLNEELLLCARGIRIEGAPGRSLNLGHAAAVVLYEANRVAERAMGEDGSTNENERITLESKQASFREIEAFARQAVDERPTVRYDDLVRFLVRVGPSQGEIALIRNLLRRRGKE